MTEKISIEIFQCSRLMQAWLVLCFVCISVFENVSRVEHECEIIGELYRLHTSFFNKRIKYKILEKIQVSFLHQ